MSTDVATKRNNDPLQINRSQVLHCKIIVDSFLSSQFTFWAAIFGPPISPKRNINYKRVFTRKRKRRGFRPLMTLAHSLAAVLCLLHAARSQPSLPHPTCAEATDTKLLGPDRQNISLGCSAWCYIKNCSSGQQDFKLQLSTCFWSAQGRQLNKQQRSTTQAPSQQECPQQVAGFSSSTVRRRTTKHSS